MITRFASLTALGLLAGLVPGLALADTTAPLRIGVLNDMSGVYSDFQGVGSVIAAQMAVEDFGGTVNGRKIEVLAGDHQNKPDIGVGLANKWYDNDGVDVIMDVPGSGIALAVADLSAKKNKAFLASGAGTSDLTGTKCTPNTVQWTYDNWALAHGLVNAASQQGAKKWFFITADYAFGHDLEREATKAIAENGGEVVGSVRHPIGTTDFSAFLLQAQSSGADIVAFANAGGDLSNALKGASEFGLAENGQKLGAFILGVNNVKALGLPTTEGILSVSSFYWDQSDASRAFAARFQKLHPNGNKPNDMQAGVYAATLDYLKAVQKSGQSADGKAVVAEMKAMGTEDPLFGTGTIRADGRQIHPVTLFKVKSPAESKGEWDFWEAVVTIPADKAFRPLKDGGCPLVAN